MSKILSIDYGRKRIGLAITDEKKKIVFPYLTLDNNKFALDELKKICAAESVKKIIIGLPIALSSRRTQQTEETKKFIELLKKRFDIPIIEEDERLTSKMAERSLSSNKDEIAAMIILQNYLEKQ